jgi:RNA ligase
MKAHHQVNVIRIEQILPHSNADKLEIVPIEGYQAVVGKGQFKVGDLAYYVPPDSVVPDREEYAFLWGNATYDGGTPLRKRRITAKKLRGEWSEGVLMPLETPQSLLSGVNVGDDVSQFLGIIHYDADEGEDTLRIKTGGNGVKGMPRSLRGWYQLIKSWFSGERREKAGPDGVPTYDVDAFKRYSKTFKEGELVEATEKIHGSNARYTFRKSFFGKEKMYIGSRNLWKAYTSTCKWKQALVDNPWIEKWCRANPGFVLYGEITPTQKGYDYGSGTKVRFFLFDVRRPSGAWMEKADYEHYGLSSFRVPLLYRGPFNLEVIKKVVDGPSTVDGAKHSREGTVIIAIPERTERGVGRAQLKIVSNVFLEKETRG